MVVSRRTMLLAGGAVAAGGVAIPASQHVAWGRRTFTRPDYDPDFPEAPEGEDSWMNWSGVQRATPEAISRPASEGALSALVARTDSRIRPFGSGHSFVGLAPSEGVMVDVSQMSGMRAIDADTGIAVFGAGTRLFQAATELADAGRALPNLPDIDVQTLAGTFSTATHGTGETLTALHDHIAGFRMVTAAGDILDVTPDSNPDLFAAGRVSLGALGIITEYTLRTVPMFNLHRQVWVEPIGTLIERAEEYIQQHRNFEFYYFPNTGYGAGISHDLHEGPVSGRGDNEDDSTLEELKALRDAVGWWPWMRRKIIGEALPKGMVEDVSDSSYKLLATTRPIKFNEMEYHLPRENGIKGLKEVIAKLERHKEVFFPMEVRVIAPDDAWLSPFNAGPRMSIAIHAAVDEPYDYFFSEIEPIHRANGGRPHWGKHHSLGKEELSALYPRFGDFMALRREMDPSGKFLNPHLAKLFGEAFDD
ncbi:D-arabinono-1,4-lactone oxidase [Hyphomonas johnsonii]|uniref:Oxidoreductase, FAD-binding protein n=1 Tax=Hyphomonas johnsonii MHS-2 TaxID=1280950 RepID=A0A059FPL4_9PROT|nr:D-arabinono-1,4-lactone oxidase [Hyphomonas johnsonii]KCZ92466.1 oxidoreductase, FAD-binding protein [Hyphomonas johnsonii MHS-2]